MSGPKTSVLSANFECYSSLSEEEKTRWAEKELLANLKNIQCNISKLDSLIEKMQILIGDSVPNERIIALIEEAKNLIDISFDDIDENQGYDEKELNDIRRGGANISWNKVAAVTVEGLESKYQEYFESIKGLNFQQKTNIARTVALKSAKVRTQARKLELAYWDLSESIKEECFREGIQTSFYLPFRMISNKSGSEPLIKKINDSLMSVASMIVTDAMLDQLVVLKEKASEIRDASFLSNFYQLVVRPFVIECEKYDLFYKENVVEYEEYKTSYVVLCEELNLVPQEMELSIEAIEFYKGKTHELQEILRKENTREYIMRTVNEVMVEMGYDMIASRDVVKRSGKRYHDELFAYGDGTAISVIHSSDGQMTMEIGGIDYGDRTPTEAESKEMSSQMVSFCKDYKVISEALRKKGIDMNTVSMLPPDEQYAMIINLEDYKVDGQVKTISEVGKDITGKTEIKKEMNKED